MQRRKPFRGLLCSWTPSATFYKLLEIERRAQGFTTWSSGMHIFSDTSALVVAQGLMAEQPDHALPIGKPLVRAALSSMIARPPGRRARSPTPGCPLGEHSCLRARVGTSLTGATAAGAIASCTSQGRGRYGEPTSACPLGAHRRRTGGPRRTRRGRRQGTRRYYVSLGTSHAVGIQPDADGMNQPTGRVRRPALSAAPAHAGRGAARQARLPRRDEHDLDRRGPLPLRWACGVPAGGGYRVPGACTRGGGHGWLTHSTSAPMTCPARTSGLAVSTSSQSRSALTSLARNLPLRPGDAPGGGGPGVPIAALNYYNPLVAAWLLAPQGRWPAHRPTRRTGSMRSWKALAAHRVPVGDVARAFHADDFRLILALDASQRRAGLPMDVDVCAAPAGTEHSREYERVLGDRPGAAGHPVLTVARAGPRAVPPHVRRILARAGDAEARRGVLEARGSRQGVSYHPRP